ncbi:MAG: hypothetical protein LBD03_03625 [Methanobrevibacter sp.]|jgi:hypothetical protein|nr:hypothetical protein [Candidatus Methanovirga procula]
MKVYGYLLLLIVCININSCFATNEDSSTVGTNVLKSSQFNGMWLWGSYMNRTNLTELKLHGINNIIIHEDVFTRNSYDDVLKWINEANNEGIKVHIWIQCFYKDGSWVKPVLENGSYTQTRFNEIIDKAVNYSKIANVSGVHLDYLRYPGTAYRATGGYMNACNAIAELTSEVNSKIKEINPKIISSAAIMPEYEDAHYYNETMPNGTNADAYYYGQDISQLGNILDYIIPMVYKGNYNKDSSWIGHTTKWFVDNSPKAKIITGLQGYVSDDDPTPLSSEELSNDANIALSNGAYGYCIFRFGLFNYIDNYTNDPNTIVMNQYSNNIVEDDSISDENQEEIMLNRTGIPLLSLLISVFLVCGSYSYKKQ